jgi:hypothetical protein
MQYATYFLNQDHVCEAEFLQVVDRQCHWSLKSHQAEPQPPLQNVTLDNPIESQYMSLIRKHFTILIHPQLQHKLEETIKKILTLRQMARSDNWYKRQHYKEAKFVKELNRQMRRFSKF